MKKIALNIFAVTLGAMAFVACDDAKNDVIDNMVYISEGATESPVKEIILAETGTVSESNFTVSLGSPAAVDTKVSLGLDAAALEQYNRRNETEFAMIPEEYISFAPEVVIPAGASSVVVPVEITSFDGEKGVDYAAPLAIKSAGEMLISKGARSFLYTFGKPLIQKVPTFRYDNAMTVSLEGSGELGSFTLEWWVRVTGTTPDNGFSINNQAIFDFKDRPEGENGKELYIRFGDITYGYGNYNFLQIKTMSIDANYDSGDPAKNPLKSGEWIHFAHVYDGATGDVKLYMNGNKVNSNNGGAGYVWNFSKMSMCSSGFTYFRDNVQLAQVRMWKVARTDAQIAKFMKKEVKYNDPNLVFYLPMNEGEGSILHDVTGHGFDVTIGSHSGASNNEAYAWTQYKWE